MTFRTNFRSTDEALAALRELPARSSVNVLIPRQGFFLQSIQNHCQAMIERCVRGQPRRGCPSRPKQRTHRHRTDDAVTLAIVLLPGLLLQNRPNGEVTDRHQGMGRIAGREAGVAQERSCASAAPNCGALGRVPA